MPKSRKRPKAVRRNRARRQQEEAAKKQSAGVLQEQSNPRLANAPRFVTDYNSAATLARLGPLVKASWSVPPALAGHLRAAGRPVPEAIHGFLLVDTGASETCMALDVAHDLGLTPVRIMKTYGAGGLHENQVFEAQLGMENKDSFGNVVQIEAIRQVAGIPELGRYLDGFKLTTSDDHPKRVVGLLGREFLQHATLVYRGNRGIVELILDPDSFRPKTP